MFSLFGGLFVYYEPSESLLLFHCQSKYPAFAHVAYKYCTISLHETFIHTDIHVSTLHTKFHEFPFKKPIVLKNNIFVYNFWTQCKCSINYKATSFCCNTVYSGTANITSIQNAFSVGLPD